MVKSGDWGDIPEVVTGLAVSSHTTCFLLLGALATSSRPCTWKNARVHVIV